MKQGHNNNSAGISPRVAFLRQHIVAAERIKSEVENFTSSLFHRTILRSQTKKMVLARFTVYAHLAIYTMFTVHNCALYTVYRVAIMCYNMDSRKGVS